MKKSTANSKKADQQEPLDSAEELKKKGNDLFSTKNYPSAIASYQRALDKLGSDDTDCRLRSQIISNIGVCQFKLEQYKLALESFSEALRVDSTWEKPFLRRSDVMEKRLEKIKRGEETETEKEEIARHRSNSDIIVDMSQSQSRKQVGRPVTKEGGRKSVGRRVVYNDLDKALADAREGERIFLEPGNYVSKSDHGFVITKHCTIVGANMSTVILQSRVFVEHYKLFHSGLTYFKNIKFMGDMETKETRIGLYINQGVDIVIEDCWFSAENCGKAKEYVSCI